MRFEADFEPEPFQGYTSFDEVLGFDTELADEWTGEVSRSSSTYVRWVQSSLNQILGLRLLVDGVAGAQTRSAVRSFEQRAGLTVDGVVGPQTEAALVAAGAPPPPTAPGVTPAPTPYAPPARSTDFIVRGAGVRPPAALSVTNFRDPAVHRFSGSSRRGRTVNEFVIHETVTRSVADTVSVLKTRGLGVHLILGPNGRMTQHGDLGDDLLSHASGHNTLSVGVEVVNPYYPSNLRPGLPWGRTIPAGWAHQGQYVLPTPAQAEAVAQLTQWITSPAAAGLAIPRAWVGLTRAASGKTLAMSRVAAAAGAGPGIYAHTYFGHADGPWLVLYAYSRVEAGMAPAAAYAEAVRLGATTRSLVPVP